MPNSIKIVSTVLALATTAASTPNAYATCTTDYDCQLNGACTNGACQCDIAWKGTNCGELDLIPEPHIAYGIGSPVLNATSAWGGGPPVYDQASGEYHLFVTEIAGNCGMCTWSRMSQAAHAVSKSLLGPYERVGLAIGTQAHNTYYSYSPRDKNHLIYHIFDGESPANCSGYYPCTDGSTPNCTGLRPPDYPQPDECRAQGGAHLHYSASLDGPWMSAGRINVTGTGMPSTAGSSNPSPWVFPNGTVLMVGRGKDSGMVNGSRTIFHNIFLYRADHWKGTYQWVRGTGVDGALNIGNGHIPTEDPTLYQGRRGFHILFHSHPGLTHAWSNDGLTWKWSDEVMGPPQQPSGDNERPRVSLDDNGDIKAVFVSQECGPGDSSRLAGFTPTAHS